VMGGRGGVIVLRRLGRLYTLWEEKLLIGGEVCSMILLEGGEYGDRAHLAEGPNILLKSLARKSIIQPLKEREI